MATDLPREHIDNKMNKIQRIITIRALSANTDLTPVDIEHLASATRDYLVLMDKYITHKGKE